MTIYIFGIFFVLAGLLLLFSPDFLFEFLDKNVKELWFYVTAIVVRFILGGFLVYYSASSNYPLAISILGWFIVAAAVVLLVMGRKNFEKLVSRVILIFRPYGRIAGLFSIAFGAFLLYAFV
ncbi:MAG: hypothetical protein HKN33_08455 [Pyrinomonadaceae bacterium]|nr:hypothetical protein [Pyrinomonadaceae bacterium]